MSLFRALPCLLLFLMAACTPVRTAQPAAGQGALPTVISTVPAPETAVPTAPPVGSAANTPTASPAAPRPTATARPTATPTATPAASPLPEGTPTTPATPIPAVRSWREPWQYYSGEAGAQGEVIYRLRYPAGWSAEPRPGGGLVIQNTQPGEIDFTQPGTVQLELRFTPALGGLPSPNMKVLAAGKPGTRQVLVDAARGVTVWNVRLYGLAEGSFILNLAGQLTGSRAEVEEGARLLEAVLQSLELYDRPDPLPPPAPPNYSPSDGWLRYAGRLRAQETSVRLAFRIPHGWWVYPRDEHFFDVANYVVVPSAAALTPGEEGAVKISFSAADCAALGNCPIDPPPLGSGRWRGVREILKSPEGYTLWTVRIYYEQTQINMVATLVGPDAVVEPNILMLNMILATLEISP